MMDRLLSVADIQARYQCGAVTARKYIREMEHIEKPLMVREKVLTEWERSKTIPGAAEIKRAIRRRAIR